LKILELNNKEYLNNDQFEFLISDLFSAVSNSNYYKRAIKGQSQGGYDVLSNDGFHKIECKQYSNPIPLSKFKTFIDKFEISNNLEKTRKFTIAVSQVVEEKKIIDLIETKNRYFIEKDINLRIEIFDCIRISNIIFDNKLYGLVLRYFGEQVFRNFFGTNLSNEYLDKAGSFYHIKTELKSEIQTPFLNEVTENLIIQNQVYRNLRLLDQINNNINNKKCCVISAPEGRGKTINSRLIGFDQYYNSGKEVFFIDLRYENSLAKIKNQIYQWSKHNNDYLLIFENSHNFENSYELYFEINNFLESSNNLYFLINSRYIIDYELSTILKDSWIKIKPTIDDALAIINLYNRNTSKEVKPHEIEAFVKGRISSDSHKSINLRLLNIILDTWKNDPNVTSILDIDDSKICLRFSSKFNLTKKMDSVLNEIEYFACIHSFDIPFNFDKIKHKTRLDYLNPLIIEGLAKNNDKGISLFHAYDAIYLFKAICILRNNDIEEKRCQWVYMYLNEIISKPEIFMKDSVSTMLKTMHRKFTQNQGFELLFQRLFEIEKQEELLIQLIKLYPMFLFNFSLYHFKEKNCDAIIGLVENYKEVVSKSLRNTNPYILISIENFIHKYVKYDLCIILFGKVEHLKVWVKKPGINSGMVNRMLDRVSLISDDHFKFIQLRRKEKQNKAYEIEGSDKKISTTKQIGAIKINSSFINSLIAEGGNPRSNNKYKFELISKNSFYLSNISWKYLGKLLHAISITYAENSGSYNIILEYLWKRIKFSITTMQVLKKSSTYELSIFLRNLKALSPAMYEEFKTLNDVNLFVENIINEFKFTDDHLYLLSHFIKEKKIVSKFKSKLNLANKEDYTNMLNFYMKNSEGIESIERESLLYLLLNRLLAEGKLNKHNN